MNFLFFSHFQQRNFYYNILFLFQKNFFHFTIKRQQTFSIITTQPFIESTTAKCAYSTTCRQNLIRRDVVCKPDPRLRSSDKRYVSTVESDLRMQTLRVSFVVIRGHFCRTRAILPDATASFAFVGPRAEKEDPD